jgi:hypothetical protein
MMACGCASLRPSSGGEIEHVVVVWLKQPGNESQREQLIERSKTFTQIPGVLRVSAGTVLPSTRPMVDSSFDVAVVFTFASEQALREYDEHPIHKRAVQELLAPLSAKVVIYDIRVK